MVPIANAQIQEILKWNIIHPLSNEIIPLGEKGSVQEALIAKGLLPDPYYGTNETEFGWIENHKWTFTSSFEYKIKIAQTIQEPDFIELQLPSIDTYAKVYLNDTLILFAENAFKPYFVEIKHLVKNGTNNLKVVFTPPTMYHQAMYEGASYHLPAPNDVHKIAIAPYTRKPQYQFGWDWALRMNTMGFNKPVRVHSYYQNEISGKNIQTISISKNHAKMKFQLFLKNDEKVDVWNSKLHGDMKFKQHGKTLTAEIEVANPKLWWPNGQGEAFLYRDEWMIENDKKEILDSEKITYGIRTSELIQEKDEWGTSYVIKVNGRAIFCKGGNYIPQDIFPARVKDEDVVKMVELMHETNFNMVRVWGGGYYPDEVFYETCDRLGLMVWQDFMFACAMYPGDDHFLENVKGEFEYQIPRISSHPSVVLFNGNNEVDVAWKNWGFQVRYMLYGKNARTIEHSYDKLFKTLAPKTVESFTSTPYIHTSPLSNWGKDEFYNHGSQHYWGVWHGKDPMEDFGTKIGRFNAEFGFQSFPEYATLSTFSTQKDWSLDSEVMKHHQKSYVGNGMILKHAERLYGKPKDFEEFIYFSQLTQARAVGISVSGHRINAPRCSGTLYWQVNDCWPGPTWSSIDYFGNWKALNYEMREDFKNVAILAKEETIGNRKLYLVSDVVNHFDCSIKIQVLDIEGNSVLKEDQVIQVDGNQSIPLKFNDLEYKKLESFHLVAEWNDEKGTIHKKMFTETGSNRIMPDQSSYSKVLKKTDKGYVLTIENTKTLVDVWICSKDKTFHLENNFETLIPGKYVFEFKSHENLTTEDVDLHYR